MLSFLEQIPFKGGKDKFDMVAYIILFEFVLIGTYFGIILVAIMLMGTMMA